MENKTYSKIILTISFFFVFIGLLSVSNSTVTAFEPSIYLGTPILFWICIITSLLLGIITIIRNLYNRYSVLGLILVTLINFIILSLFIIKGYFFWNASGDPGIHWQFTQPILSTGHFLAQKNFYPLTHIFLTQLNLVSSVPLEIIFKLLPAYIFLLFPLFMFLIAHFLAPEKKDYILITLSSTPLIFGWYLDLTPSTIANLLFPFAVYLLFRSYYSPKIQWKILFIIIPFLYAPFHPVPAFALLLIVCVLWLQPINLKQLNFLKSNIKENRNFNYAIALLFIVLITTWISSFGIWESTIVNTKTLLTEGGSTQYDMLSKSIEGAQDKNYNVFLEAFKIYGAVIIYMIIAVLTFTFIKRERPHLLNLYWIIGLLTIFLGFFYFLNLSFGPTRLITYILILLTIPVGIGLSRFIQKGGLIFKSSNIPSALVILLVFSVTLMGIISVYPSHYTLSVNRHTTESSLKGTEWFINNKNTNLSYSTWYFAPDRYAGRLGIEKLRADVTKYNSVPFPAHFGYNVNSTLGESYTKDTYLLIPDFLKVVYVYTFPERANEMLTTSDFNRLNEDNSLDKLYSDGGFDLWYIHSK